MVYADRRRLKHQGITAIRVVSEKIDTHVYESRTLSKAFEEITGITVQHEIIPEGEVVDKLYAAIKVAFPNTTAGFRTPT
jgi:glycerol transport system substrate-binding protein